MIASTVTAVEVSFCTVPSTDIFADLTPAEQATAKFVALGKTAKEIANLRNVAPKTVEHQTQSLMRKMRFANCAQLTAFCLYHGLISYSDFQF